MDLQITKPTIQMYPDGRMDAANAARYAGLAPKTLAMMRCSGTGPKFVKRGRIFYFKEDLDQWLGEHRTVSTAQAQQIKRSALATGSRNPKVRSKVLSKASTITKEHLLEIAQAHQTSLLSSSLRT
jgi:hypothetical protein